MSKFEQWPLWLQLLFGIPNAIVMTILLVVWWPKNAKELKRYEVFAVPYLILFFLFYLLFG